MKYLLNWVKLDKQRDIFVYWEGKKGNKFIKKMVNEFMSK